MRARYMNPDTGTFISMDSYPGSTGDPVSLHKYLYANANPVMYTDPSGYFSLAECSAVTSIQSALNSMHQITAIRNIIRWADAACTVYDTAMEIRNVLLGGGSIEDVAGALLKGVVVGFMVDGMCKTSLGIILKPMMAIFGLGDQAYQLQEAIRSGDPVEITVRFVQLACMLFGLTSQCFTGDTLVSTEHGLRPIEEIQAGDYVWSENTETGEKELKKVLGVSVTETTVLVHVSMEDGTEINTTENHPFYVEGKGWCAASGLEDGDILHAQDGSAVTVKDVEARQLDEAVKVYNLEIEEYHTYYVSGREVLVHNVCDVESGSSSTKPEFETWLNKGASDNKVYFGIDKDMKPSYTGITKQTKKARLYQHNRKGKDFLDLEIQYDNLTRNQARAIEQYFIEKGPNTKNEINSISINHRYYNEAIEWAKKYLGQE